MMATNNNRGLDMAVEVGMANVYRCNMCDRVESDALGGALLGLRFRADKWEYEVADKRATETHICSRCYGAIQDIIKL